MKPDNSANVPSVGSHELLAMRDAQVRMVLRCKEALTEAEDKLRDIEKQISDAAPATCEICNAGVYEPHTHYYFRRRGRGEKVTFKARMIPRDNAAVHPTANREASKP